MSTSDFATWADWNAGGGRRGPALVKPELFARLHKAFVKTPEIKDPKPGTAKTGHYALGWGWVKMTRTPEPVLTHNGSITQSGDDPCRPGLGSWSGYHDKLPGPKSRRGPLGAG